jgi:branched-chain amino acid transport system permease protein
MAFLRYSLWGRAIRAVSSSPEMARTVGIDLKRVHLLTYAVGSAISAPAGILVAMDVGVEPYRGTTFVLLASVAVIMGGIGSIPGALLGALFLALLENLGVWKIPSEWQSTISFGVFLVFIVVRPRGFFGRRIQSAEL